MLARLQATLVLITEAATSNPATLATKRAARASDLLAGMHQRRPQANRVGQAQGEKYLAMIIGWVA
jgi:hypothetical protein